MKRKTYILICKIIGKNVPDFGQGKGVLGSLELDIDLRNPKGIQEVQILETQEKLMHDLVVVEVKEKS